MHKPTTPTCLRGRLIAAALLAFLWPTAVIQAQWHVDTGPVAGHAGGPELGGSGYFEDVKSAPLANSGMFSTTWGLHQSGLAPNYAGMLFNIVYDGHELSHLEVGPAQFHDMWAGPATNPTTTPYVRLEGSQSVTQSAMLSVWHTAATNSGTELSPSVLVPFFWLNGYAKNTTPCNNSDIDIYISPWIIYHAGTQVSARTNACYITVYFQASDYQYLSAAGGWATALGAGTWEHVTSPGSMQVPCSAFYARALGISNVAGYGIEHVPEPASALLMVAGAGSMLVGRKRRRRSAEIC